MRIMKKLLSVAVALSLCASLAAPAFAVEYDISDGSVHVENNDDGDAVSWQDGHDEHYDKDTGSKDKDIVVKQEKDEEPTKNTIDVGTDVKDVEITLKDVNIDVSDENEAAVSVGAGSDVTIELDGDNSLKSGVGHAGLELNNDNEKGKPQEDADGGSVTIKDDNGIDGSLTAEGGDSAAGIGGGSKDIAGDITIDNADVTATGGSGGAGIGTGSRGEAGDIIVNGGDVTATGGSDGAGIGTGSRGEAGNITVNGGDVTATGGSSGAGIGTGLYGTVADITIDNSDVTATGGNSGAGIGTGLYGTVADITIDNSEVTATGGQNGAGIGGGNYGSTGDIDVEESDVTAKGGAGTAAGIGVGKSYGKKMATLPSRAAISLRLAKPKLLLAAMAPVRSHLKTSRV
uniref:hypothetical protein n=1 Tax=uncultured Oscillibacter sp. TaxID=876091 RepID=UPI00272D71ED|nr:hypothetical protein [uncultured Oscillibacter sp.]